jgi:malate synthase
MVAALPTTTDGPSPEAVAEILTPAALAFIGELHSRFDARRRALLAERETVAAHLASGGRLDFLSETAEIRAGSWTVAEPPIDYLDRRTEITGPTDRKLVINALNSGARGFMADFEDANSPTWANQLDGQLNLREAVDGTIAHRSSNGRQYLLNPETATLLVRPRGLHLLERHLEVNGEPVAGALADFGLYAFHCARRLVAKGRGVYFYLPKLEHHREARLWSDVLRLAEEALGLSIGTMRATVLIETLPAAFQMDEILFELRDHSLGLNAGRWDYIFSMIKCLGRDPAFLTPDRSAITMTAPFMAAYAELLVKTCHRRGTFAMGGMAAVIPSRTDSDANERAFEAVRADKRREATSGFDGTWVAHPDVVQVAAGEFDAVTGSRFNQIHVLRDDVAVTAENLLAVASTPGDITPEGVRNNVNVCFQYISFWLTGRGAAGINGLMEDAATAEICRAQLWQWIHHGRITRDGVLDILDEEMRAIRTLVGEETWATGRPDTTRIVFEQVALADELPPFLTISAYELLEDGDHVGPTADQA